MRQGIKASAARWIAVCLLSALPSLVVAQAPKGAPIKAPLKPAADQALLAPDSGPKVDVSVFPSDKYRTISGGFDVYVTVTNTTPHNIRHWDSGVCFPGAVWSLIGSAITPNADKEPCSRLVRQTPSQKPVPELQPGKETRTQKEPVLELQPGKQAYFHLGVPKMKKRFSWDEMFFRRDNYAMQAFAMYQAPGDNENNLRVARVETALEFRPSLLAPLSGVIVGTFLVSVFIGLRRTAKFATALQSTGMKPQAVHWAAAKHWLANTGRVWISGLISGMILVVVLNQTDTQQLPVTVSINDFWGGAFLGLVAYKLADWLDEKFFAKTP